MVLMRAVRRMHTPGRPAAELMSVLHVKLPAAHKVLRVGILYRKSW